MRIGFETLGCRSNYADTVDLQASLAELGLTPCESQSGVDVFVLNTCTVTNDADRVAFKTIKRVKRLSPDARIIVTGCLAEVGRRELLDTGLVDAVVGPGRRREVLEAITGKSLAAPPRLEPHEQLVGLPRRRTRRSLPARHSISLDEPMSAAIVGPGNALGESRVRARYHLRVQEGCENACTFCIIPLTRGRLSSRDRNHIVADLHHLAHVGYKEVVLTGTHLGGYGEDRGDSLVSLLELLRDESPVRRIRLSSIDPNDVSTRLLQVLASDSLFCNHLHICVQAFSDRTLKRMNRRYSLERAIAVLNETRDAFGSICLGSDLIAGFPGETREEVEEGIELFASTPLSYLHVFPYSERRETPAIRLADSVPPAERRRRAARWRAVSDQAWLAFQGALVGKPLEILVETYDDTFLYGTGREFSSLKVSVDALDSPGEAIIGDTLNVMGVAVDTQDERLLCE